jgi:GxxExxY protein
VGEKAGGAGEVKRHYHHGDTEKIHSTQIFAEQPMRNADKNYIHSDLTEKIIRCVYDVYTELGPGFLEKVYENALLIRLREIGLSAIQQVPLAVLYHGTCVGEYLVDILVEDTVIVELKALSELVKVHEVQLVSYLKATGKQVGLLVNFGDKIKIVRRVQSSKTKV